MDEDRWTFRFLCTFAFVERTLVSLRWSWDGRVVVLLWEESFVELLCKTERREERKKERSSSHDSGSSLELLVFLLSSNHHLNFQRSPAEPDPLSFVPSLRPERNFSKQAQQWKQDRPLTLQPHPRRPFPLLHPLKSTVHPVLEKRPKVSRRDPRVCTVGKWIVSSKAEVGEQERC